MYASLHIRATRLSKEDSYLMDVLLDEDKDRKNGFKRVTNIANFDVLLHEVCLEYGYEFVAQSGVFHDGNSVRHLYQLKKLVGPVKGRRVYEDGKLNQVGTLTGEAFCPLGGTIFWSVDFPDGRDGEGWRPDKIRDYDKYLARQKRASELVRIDRFQAEKLKRESPHTIGRCWVCKRAYIWKKSSKRSLDEERCPIDHGSLSQTMLTYKGAWFKV
jgi:hypothetical protein